MSRRADPQPRTEDAREVDFGPKPVQNPFIPDESGTARLLLLFWRVPRLLATFHQEIYMFIRLIRATVLFLLAFLLGVGISSASHGTPTSQPVVQTGS